MFVRLSVFQWSLQSNCKQKELDADSRAIQEIEFYGISKTNSQVCTVLEKSKEAMLEFYKGTAKVLWII